MLTNVWGEKRFFIFKNYGTYQYMSCCGGWYLFRESLFLRSCCFSLCFWPLQFSFALGWHIWPPSLPFAPFSCSGAIQDRPDECFWGAEEGSGQGGGRVYDQRPLHFGQEPQGGPGLHSGVPGHAERPEGAGGNHQEGAGHVQDRPTIVQGSAVHGEGQWAASPHPPTLSMYMALKLWQKLLETTPSCLPGVATKRFASDGTGVWLDLGHVGFYLFCFLSWG